MARHRSLVTRKVGGREEGSRRLAKAGTGRHRQAQAGTGRHRQGAERYLESDQCVVGLLLVHPL